MNEKEPRTPLGCGWVESHNYSSSPLFLSLYTFTTTPTHPFIILYSSSSLFFLLHIFLSQKKQVVDRIRRERFSAYQSVYTQLFAWDARLTWKPPLAPGGVINRPKGTWPKRLLTSRGRRGFSPLWPKSLTSRCCRRQTKGGSTERAHGPARERSGVLKEHVWVAPPRDVA